MTTKFDFRPLLKILKIWYKKYIWIRATFQNPFLRICSTLLVTFSISRIFERLISILNFRIYFSEFILYFVFITQFCFLTPIFFHNNFFTPTFWLFLTPIFIPILFFYNIVFFLFYTKQFSSQQYCCFLPHFFV